MQKKTIHLNLQIKVWYNLPECTDRPPLADHRNHRLMVLKIHSREEMQTTAASRVQFSLLRSFNIISLKSRCSSWVRISYRVWFQYWCSKNFEPCPIFLPAQNKPTAGNKKWTESPLMCCCQIGYWCYFPFNLLYKLGNAYRKKNNQKINSPKSSMFARERIYVNNHCWNLLSLRKNK